MAYIHNPFPIGKYPPKEQESTQIPDHTSDFFNRAMACGYARGKTQARKEMAWVAVVVGIIILIGGVVRASSAATPNWSEGEWEKVESAIQQVETGGQPNGGQGVVGDNGEAIGPLQIHKSCYKDACEFDKSLDKGYNTCLNDLEYSKRVVRAYISRYLPKGGTAEDAARLWNSGPQWSKKKAKTEGYVKKFRKFYQVLSDEHVP